MSLPECSFVVRRFRRKASTDGGGLSCTGSEIVQVNWPGKFWCSVSKGKDIFAQILCSLFDYMGTIVEQDVAMNSIGINYNLRNILITDRK